MSAAGGDLFPAGLRGIVPSLNTPFTADGAVDADSLDRLIDHVTEVGCVGLLMLAVAGEAPSLSSDEKRLLIERVSARNAGRIPMIVGVTAEDRRDRLRLARWADAAGADAVLWQPGPGLSEDEIADGLSALGEAGPGPVILQDLDWSGAGLPITTIVRLFERVPAFRAIKIETIPAGPKYSAVLEATGGDLHVSGGWAVGQMMDALARGVHAFMPTGLELVYCRIHRLYRSGRVAQARTLFEAVLPVLAFANQHIDVSIRFFKALRVAAGLFADPYCRPPVAPLDAIHYAECARLTAYAQTLDEPTPKP